MNERAYFNRVFLDNWRPRKYDKYYLYDRYARLIEDGGRNIRCYPAKRQFDALLSSAGNTILDCACGAGELAVWLALNGKKVYAFDFSESAIQIARESAALSGVADKIQFDVMDVRALKYQSGFFDVITGNDCLHHLIKWPAGVAELARVLKPGGRGLFVEPLAWNPFINLLRRLGTWKHHCGAYECFLTKAHIKLLKGAFGALFLSEHVVFSSLTRLIAAGHGTTRLNRFQRTACVFMKKADDFMLRVMPGLRNLSSMAFLELIKTNTMDQA